MHGMLAAGFCLCMGAQVLFAQSSQSTQAPPSSPAPSSARSPAPGQQGNPFPDETPEASQKPAAAQNPAAKPDAAKPQPKSSSDNPFPGEDSNAPIIPVDPNSNSGAGGDEGSASRPPRPNSDADSAATPRRDADPDGDPVRSPDSTAHEAGNDGFSSSRAGMKDVPAEDESIAKPGKSLHAKTREQMIKEDLDVGGFYMDKKNWKAAQARFTSAFSLDSESPEAVYGLAEAERHLQLYKEAEGHYKLFLSYDPDGPHSKTARKALEEVEAALPAASASSKESNTGGSSPK